eukprot:8313061-Ditylum_brightwellii.AAC.1
MAGNLLAILLRFNTGLICSGLFGYNSVLVGPALATFDSSEEHSGWYAPIPVTTINFDSFSFILFVFMGKTLFPYQSPSLMLPFNTGPVVVLSFPDYYSNNVDMSITAKQLFSGTIQGIGQVLLLPFWAALGVVVVLATGSEPSAIEHKMVGFNPSLTVTAMFMFYAPTFGAGIFALMAGIMTVAGK